MSSRSRVRACFYNSFRKSCGLLVLNALYYPDWVSREVLGKMKISKKCEYALKAVFELASRDIDKPVKIHSIAQAQGISHRFLEAILNELKHGGFVESRRGNGGGYILARDAKELTVGEIFEYMQGTISVVPDSNKKSKESIAHWGDNAFGQLWQEVDQTMLEVWNSKTFADLVEFERNNRNDGVSDYII